MNDQISGFLADVGSALVGNKPIPASPPSEPSRISADTLAAAVDKLERLLARATLGPWTAHPDGLVWPRRLGDPVSASALPEDAELIVTLANAAPAIVASLRSAAKVAALLPDLDGVDLDLARAILASAGTGCSTCDRVTAVLGEAGRALTLAVGAPSAPEAPGVDSGTSEAGTEPLVAPEAEEEAPSATVDLMAALRVSVERAREARSAGTGATS